MTVGSQANSTTVDAGITNLSVAMRNVMGQINNLWTFVNNGAAGTPVEVLTELGYDNTNSNAPGNQSDAAYASYIIDELHTVAQIYFGQASQATAYDFDGALAPMWAGQ